MNNIDVPIRQNMFIQRLKPRINHKFELDVYNIDYRYYTYISNHICDSYFSVSFQGYVANMLYIYKRKYLYE